MCRKLFVELYDVEGFMTSGRTGVCRREEFIVDAELELQDVLNDLAERYGEPLSKTTIFENSVFVEASFQKEKHMKHLVVLKQSSSKLNASICIINEICMYMSSKYTNVFS